MVSNFTHRSRFCSSFSQLICTHSRGGACVYFQIRRRLTIIAEQVIIWVFLIIPRTGNLHKWQPNGWMTLRTVASTAVRMFHSLRFCFYSCHIFATWTVRVFIRSTRTRRRFNTLAGHRSEKGQAAQSSSSNWSLNRQSLRPELTNTCRILRILICSPHSANFFRRSSYSKISSFNAINRILFFAWGLRFQRP